MPGTMPLATYPPRDQEFVMRTQRATARIQEVMGGYTGLQAPKAGFRASTEYIPMAYSDGPSLRPEHPGSYHGPRRLSSSSASTITSSVTSPRDSFDSRPRSSSFNSSQSSLEWSPTLSSGPSPRSSSAYTHYQLQNNKAGYYPWQRPVPIKTRQKVKPGELFAALPGEVLELILEELRNLHLQPSSNSCATCWMRDCCSIALSARKFIKYARESLYQHIYLVGAEGPNMKKRTKLSHGSRLVLLRRTLRANPHIAVIVRSLKPPAVPSTTTIQEYNDLVASVVMACPNLERLVGFYPTYNHSFQRVFHALSTRPRLREMNWIIDSPPFQRQFRTQTSPGGNQLLRATADLQPQQSEVFLNFHVNWQQLTTLVIHVHLGATLSPHTLLDHTLRCLPSLQNLILSHLPHDAFNDTNLLALPCLKRLSLSHLSGVTTAGLSSMATRSASTSITTLTLIHMNVESLPALARIFSNLSSLETFNIVQAYAPIMPTDEYIWLFPYLASQSLRKLHWDIPYLPTRATTADTILAKSISANGFPALRMLRAPNDPEGIFQTLCYPSERVDFPTDRFRNGHHQQSSYLTAAGLLQNGHGRTGSGYTQSSNRKSIANISGNQKPSSAPSSPLFPPDTLMLPRDNSNLHQARLAAQARLETARRFPRFFVNVVDEDGTVVEKFGIGGFLGTVESKISYVLRPDAGGTDEGGGLVTAADMLGDCGEALVLQQQQGSDDKGGSMSKKDRKKLEAAEMEARTREGCVGRWNMISSSNGQMVDKNDKERWWHAERGRWKGVALS
ncbi:hypothetical protein B0H66DRAFT_465105 [Apodospora peruviana]|uniref:F-box domain-containing protein n=1 Tax=Apodospora peruviana TaxID=516989 RepID=A0AAE0IT71_9PEZI|nr:hypothetical protein B0H66DRAFT_465105 [Apodospora peruviana]